MVNTNHTTPFQRILVPVDGSSCSDAAISLALRLAASGGELLFANVIDLGAAIGSAMTPYAGEVTPLLETLEAEQKMMLEQAMGRAHAAGVAAKSVALTGSPVDTLVRYGGESGADAIVMGTHGRQGLARIALGSVAEGVLRRSTVPAIIVHAAPTTVAAGVR